MKEQKPVIGEQIYIPSSNSDTDKLFSESGIVGGLGTISDIGSSYQDIFIQVEELPYYSFNYKDLLKQQEQLKAEFGNTVARPNLYHLKQAKKWLKEEAASSIEEALQAIYKVTGNTSVAIHLFDEGDRAAVKAMKLGLLRLQEKVKKKR